MKAGKKRRRVQALEWIDEKMIPYYPLGVYKDRSAEAERSNA